MVYMPRSKGHGRSYAFCEHREAQGCKFTMRVPRFLGLKTDIVEGILSGSMPADHWPYVMVDRDAAA